MKRLLILALLAPTLAWADSPVPTPAPVDKPYLTVDFSKAEADALIQLLDIAVKSCGLPCAQNALALASKLQPKPEN